MKQQKLFTILTAGLFILVLVISCTFKKKSEQVKKPLAIEKNSSVKVQTYIEDVHFMKNYIDLIELSDPSGKSKVAISADLQGRVMTSSAYGDSGRSYGWINKELFASKDTLEHINVFGGEERFWLGPEGGQYSIFFKKGTA